jgi:hypothetical protein
MAIGSFVNGVFQGMQARDTMDNNKRLRKMEDTRFEREGEKHGWDKEKHGLAMERARRGLKPKPMSAYEAVASRFDGGDYPAGTVDTGGSVDYGAGNGGPAPLTSFPRSGAPAGQTMQSAPLLQSAPRQMSINQAIPAAAQPQQVAQGPMEFDFIPGQGLIPRGVA